MWGGGGGGRPDPLSNVITILQLLMSGTNKVVLNI